MPIRLLSPDVVSKIAAGEVVERPASVVKELIENSLDAGASHIGIEVRGGGVSLIRVSDNGTGIPAEEVELAFQPHATSKIRSLADLDTGTSLGFRGEALHSMAHVARVELLTRTEGDASGTLVSLRDGAVMARGVRAAPGGTTVTVRDLFRDVPARLKFLKSATTESNQITNLVSQYCLAFPGVKFTLSVDGREVLRTPGSGRLKDAIAEVYGLDAAQAMLEIRAAVSEAGMTPVVTGYTSPPSLTRATRGYLSFFVNGRWVQSRLLAGAVEKAYEGWLGVRRHPISVINIAVPPQFVDVNVPRSVRLPVSRPRRGRCPGFRWSRGVPARRSRCFRKPGARSCPFSGCWGRHLRHTSSPRGPTASISSTSTRPMSAFSLRGRWRSAASGPRMSSLSSSRCRLTSA
jgi:DNA mismatch repair protein MutL